MSGNRRPVLMEYGLQRFRTPDPWSSPPAAKAIEPASQRPRSPLKIRLDILEILRDGGPSGPADLIRSANLAHGRVVKYLRELVSQGLLTESPDNGRSYSVTAKGLEFVKQLKEVEAFLAGFGFGL